MSYAPMSPASPALRTFGPTNVASVSSGVGGDASNAGSMDSSRSSLLGSYSGALPPQRASKQRTSSPGQSALDHSSPKQFPAVITAAAATMSSATAVPVSPLQSHAAVQPPLSPQLNSQAQMAMGAALRLRPAPGVPSRTHGPGLVRTGPVAQVAAGSSAVATAAVAAAAAAAAAAPSQLHQPSVSSRGHAGRSAAAAAVAAAAATNSSAAASVALRGRSPVSSIPTAVTAIARQGHDATITASPFLGSRTAVVSGTPAQQPRRGVAAPRAGSAEATSTRPLRGTGASAGVGGGLLATRRQVPVPVTATSAGGASGGRQATAPSGQSRRSASAEPATTNLDATCSSMTLASSAAVASTTAGALSTSPEAPTGKPPMDEQQVQGDVVAPPREDSVAKFMQEAQSASQSAILLSKLHIDVAQYWEKRRVQNGLRRLLESLQERFRLENDSQAHELEPAWEAIAAVSNGHPSSASSEQKANELRLDEQQVCSALESLGSWTPELSPSDKAEIFSALLVPSLAVARDLVSGQEPPRTVINCRGFCDGFDRVPFNLPDFPVPAHYLHSASGHERLEPFRPEQTEAVAKIIATTFSVDSTGLEIIKDFFLCGLISVEEIQRALPKLVPSALVQDAVTRIIRCGAPMILSEDWDSLVVTMRSGAAAMGLGATPPGATPPAGTPSKPPAQTNAGAQPEASGSSGCLVSLATPPPQHRELAGDVTGAAVAAALGSVDTCSAARAQSAAADGSRASPEDSSPAPLLAELACSTGDAAMQRFRGRFEPVTEPLPCRELLSEEPVRFMHSEAVPPLAAAVAPPAVAPPAVAAAEPAAPMPAATPASVACSELERVVDWSTAKASGGGTSNGHQADVGAGARSSWGTSGFKQQLADKAKALAAIAAQGGLGPHASLDHLAWINLDLHNEGSGPYLARAFVLCCQNYGRLQ